MAFEDLVGENGEDMECDALEFVAGREQDHTIFI
jgi:hypothetical protein